MQQLLRLFLCRGVSVVNQEALFVPNQAVRGATVSLSKCISAVRLRQKEDGGGTKLGTFSQLRPGTVVVICGEGFDERTIKVRVEELYYFVFAQDIEFAALESGRVRSNGRL